MRCRATSYNQEMKQDEDGDDDGDADDTDDDDDADDNGTNVTQSNAYKHRDTEAAVVDADTSEYFVYQIISCKGEANGDSSVRCRLAVSCLCLCGVGRCQYQREPLLFPCVLQAP